MNINIASKLLSPVVKGSCRSGIGVIAAMLIMGLPLVLPANAQGSGNLLQAAKDIEAAETFSQVQRAIDSHETVWNDPSTVAVLDSVLASPSLALDIRLLRQLERELALDYQRYGREGAARLFSIRMLAAASVTVQSVQKFVAIMGGFSELADNLNPTLVRAALRSAACNYYTPAQISRMEQLGRDWPRYGALNAATRMAQSSRQSGSVKRSTGRSNTSTFDRRYFEDRTAEQFLKLGRPIPDGLIMNPVYP